MSTDDYIWKLKKANPNIFAAEEIQISIPSFELQLRKAFEAGMQAGTGDNLFNSLFGPGPRGRRAD